MCPTTGPHVTFFPLVPFSSSSPKPPLSTERANHSTLTPPSSPQVELSLQSPSAPSSPGSPRLPSPMVLLVPPLPHCAFPILPYLPTLTVLLPSPSTTGCRCLLPSLSSPPSPNSLLHHRRWPPIPSSLTIVGRHLRACHRRQSRSPSSSPSSPAISELVTVGSDENEAVLPDPARQRLDSTGSKSWPLDPVSTRPR